MKLAIRPATAADVPLILQFIRELADYEHLTHEVTATGEKLRATLFGPRPFAEALIGSVDGVPRVYVKDHDQWVPRIVRVGMDNNRMIQLLEGVREGEEVMLAPPVREQKESFKGSSARTGGAQSGVRPPREPRKAPLPGAAKKSGAKAKDTKAP